jgi:hypothetical protein
MDLDHRVAGVCRRMGRLLARLPAVGDGALGESLGLLVDLAERQPRVPDPGRLRRLVMALGCSPVEVDLIVLAGLPDQHESIAALFRMLHPRAEPRPTLGLAAQLLCDDAGERPYLLRAADQGRALESGTLRIGPPDAPTYERTLSLPEGLWSALRGLDTWPDAAGVRDAPPVQAGLEAWLASAPAQAALTAIRCGAPQTILVTAEHEDLALERAVALVAASGAAWVRAAPTATDPASLRTVLAHALARGVIPALRLPAADGGGTALPDLRGHPSPVVLAARAGSAPAVGMRSVVSVPAEPLDAAGRRRMWRTLLPGLDSPTEALASRHIVEPAVAALAADDVRAVSALRGRPPTIGDLVTSIRARAGMSLSHGVTLVHPSAGWGQLVLPAARLDQLRDAADRLVHQERVFDDWGFLAGRTGARGVRLLFAGPPGTGKTLAAEVLARELGVDLLVVDIARVVSKWIGETEKNLSEVFDAAERVNGVLLFDEADALFGKRTEVSDAHDRYANLETAYLLARLERSEGMVILATNLRSNVDPAFTRRLEAVVPFEEPGQDERVALWRCHVPPNAPVAADVDFEELAALFPVVGGVIRNAAVAAAFLAAAGDGPIRRHHIVRAIRREYEKQGRAFPAIPVDILDHGRR